MKRDQLTAKEIRRLDRLRLDATRENTSGVGGHLESDFRDSMRYYWPQLKALALRALKEKQYG